MSFPIDPAHVVRRKFLKLHITHIAIQEQPDGKVVNWMEKVSDEQYQA